MDDWKLKACVVVKLKKESDMFVTSHRIFIYFYEITITRLL